MQMISTALIGLSLSLDAFAVSVSSGISIPGLRRFYAVRGALVFGFFQFLMPVVGWYLGKTFAASIEVFDHWVAFALLAFIGGKMLAEALGHKTKARTSAAARTSAKDAPEAAETETAAGAKQAGPDIRNLAALLTLAVATSIDALAVGISFSILNQGIWMEAGIIGAITFLVCLAGFEAGKRIGFFFEKWAQVLGGLILIGLGIKILLEHYFFAAS